MQRAKTLSEIFIHDPGAGQFSFLASSLTAFVELNDLFARWDDLCEAEDVDPDPEVMDEGDIDFYKPAFGALRARAKALKGRVSLVTGSDFDETVCALAGATLRAKSASDVASLYERWKHTKLGRP